MSVRWMFKPHFILTLALGAVVAVPDVVLAQRLLRSASTPRFRRGTDWRPESKLVGTGHSPAKQRGLAATKPADADESAKEPTPPLPELWPPVTLAQNTQSPDESSLDDLLGPGEQSRPQSQRGTRADPDLVVGPSEEPLPEANPQTPDRGAPSIAPDSSRRQPLAAESESSGSPFLDDAGDRRFAPSDAITPIGEVGTSIAISGQLIPEDDAAQVFAEQEAVYYGRVASRGFAPSSYHWTAAATCHRPLLFEEANAERYGHNFGFFQPAISAAHFTASVAALPYNYASQHPRRCIYTLGHYRPGNCVPRRVHWPQLSLTGGLFQAGMVTGLVFVIP